MRISDWSSDVFSSDLLQDPEVVDRLGRFISASVKGWQYAIDNVDEAAEIIVDADPSGAATVEVQKRQIENIATLITNASGKGIGYLAPAAYRRTVDVLMSGESDPAITRDPGDARSEERRVGKEWGSTCRSWWCPY